MKLCEFCGVEKSISEFTMRKRPPIQPYKYCKACEPVAYSKKSANYSEEVKIMRRKAEQLRAFTPTQDIEIYRRVMNGETRSHIATEFGVSFSTVRKAVARGEKLTSAR